MICNRRFMSMSFWLSVTVLLVFAMSEMANATSYISICTLNARKVWNESGVIYIGASGDSELTIAAIESNPQDVDTCWIYIDGNYTTDSNLMRSFNPSAYRMYYGVVVIKYINDTYESKEFRICPAWSVNDDPSTSAQAPASYSVPSDQTAATLIGSVALSDPDGPSEIEYYNCCDEGMCSPMIATRKECDSDLDCQ